MTSNKDELRFLIKKARHASLFGAFAMDGEELARLIELSRAIGDGKSQGDALLYAARIHLNRNNVREAERLIEQIRDIANAAGDFATMALARALRAELQIHAGNADEAYDSLEQAVRTAEESGDQRVKSEVLTHFARAAYDLGKYEEAEKTAREARALGLSSGNRTAKLFATKHLASVVHYTSRFEEAWRYMEEALSYADSAEFRFVQPGLYEGLGCVCANLGFHERSLEYLRKSRSIAGEVGHHRTKIMAASTTVIVLIEMGDLDGAFDELRELKTLVNRYYPDVFNLAVAYSYETEIRALLTAGDYEKALNLAEKLIQKGEESSIYLAKVWGTLGKGNSLLRLRRFEEAFEVLKQAFIYSSEVNDNVLIMSSLYSLFKVFKETGRDEEARQTLDEAVRVVKNVASKICDGEYRSNYLKKGYTARLIVEIARAEGMSEVVGKILAAGG